MTPLEKTSSKTALRGGARCRFASRSKGRDIFAAVDKSAIYANLAMSVAQPPRRLSRLDRPSTAAPSDGLKMTHKRHRDCGSYACSYY
jgi:hypothetical protein